ncbi:hypothetical protein GCM10010983_16660 [Caulobacter rhizosphaerae]|nr:hypothetical protein GCM10010983_16660 [Caulobacter rhizosphaerae]
MGRAPCAGQGDARPGPYGLPQTAWIDAPHGLNLRAGELRRNRVPTQVSPRAPAYGAGEGGGRPDRAIALEKDL